MRSHHLVTTALFLLAFVGTLPGAETLVKEGVTENKITKLGSVLFCLPLDDTNPLPGLRSEVHRPDAANAQASWHPSLGTIREKGSTIRTGGIAITNSEASPTTYNDTTARPCYSQPDLGASPALR